MRAEGEVRKPKIQAQQLSSRLPLAGFRRRGAVWRVLPACLQSLQHFVRFSADEWPRILRHLFEGRDRARIPQMTKGPNGSRPKERRFMARHFEQPVQG